MNKCIIVGILFCILSVTFASNNFDAIEKAYSEVRMYTQGIRSMTVSASSECNDQFVANVDRLVEIFHENTFFCVNNATMKRNSNNAETGFLRERAQIESLMTSITKYFNDCSEQKGLWFFNCFPGNFDYSLVNMNKINEISFNVISSNHGNTAKIDEEERACILNAVEYYKDESQRNINELNDCLN